MDRSNSEADFKAGLVSTLSRRPSALGKINIAVSIVYTV